MILLVMCSGFQMDGNGDGCYAAGSPIVIHYLNQFTIIPVEDACAGSVKISLAEVLLRFREIITLSPMQAQEQYREHQ